MILERLERIYWKAIRKFKETNFEVNSQIKELNRIKTNYQQNENYGLVEG